MMACCDARADIAFLAGSTAFFDSFASSLKFSECLFNTQTPLIVSPKRLIDSNRIFGLIEPTRSCRADA